MKLVLIVLILSVLQVSALAQNAIQMDKPLREVAVIVTKTGFYPNAISVHEGEKVRFFVTSTEDAPDCFVLENHKVFLAAQKGKITEKEVVFDDAGRFKFYCPSSKNKGFITVIEKVLEQKEPVFSGGRKTASDYDDGAPTVWTPKDY